MGSTAADAHQHSACTEITSRNAPFEAPALAGKVIDGAAYSSAHIITAQNPSPSIVPFITPLAAAKGSPSSSRSLSGESSGIREELDIRRIHHPPTAPPCRRLPSCEALKRQFSQYLPDSSSEGIIRHYKALSGTDYHKLVLKTDLLGMFIECSNVYFVLLRSNSEPFVCWMRTPPIHSLGERMAPRRWYGNID